MSHESVVATSSVLNVTGDIMLLSVNPDSRVQPRPLHPPVIQLAIQKLLLMLPPLVTQHFGHTRANVYYSTLQTATAIAFNPDNPSKTSRVCIVLDTGSQNLYVIDNVRNQLSLSKLVESD